jgi:hypothetical protein
MKWYHIVLIAPFILCSCDTQESKQPAAGEHRPDQAQNLRGTGIWENDTFVDELGVTRDRACIKNTGFLAGIFSNSSTPHSPLNVRLTIFGPNNISLQLFENGGSEPLKALTPVSYTVTVTAADGTQHRVKAMNYSDKVAFERTDAATVHDILMKGGKVQFNIGDDFNATNRYQFAIENASGYDVAYKTLTEAQ